MPCFREHRKTRPVSGARVWYGLKRRWDKQHLPGGQAPLLQLIGLKDLMLGGGVGLGDVPQSLPRRGQTQHHRGLLPLLFSSWLPQDGGAHRQGPLGLEQLELELGGKTHLQPACCRSGKHLPRTQQMTAAHRPGGRFHPAAERQSALEGLQVLFLVQIEYRH